MDVVTAFLNPAIDSDNVYMSMPPGIEWLDSCLQKTSIVRLLKALYGLKQAPRLWYQNINSFLLSIGFTQSIANPNLYLRKGVLLLLYVDDILIVQTSNDRNGEEVKDQLRHRYKMTDLGKATRFLELEIGWNHDRSITLGQKAYINSIIKRFNLEKATLSSIPIDLNINLDNKRCEDKAIDKHTYLSMIGSLMYAALGTRLDIAYAVTVLSRYNQEPLAMHFTAAQKVIRYLKGTLNSTIIYKSANETTNYLPKIFTDSDWAGRTATRKSVGGCAIMGPGNSGAIHWTSKNQSVVALSTLEAEFIACSDATREALWFRQLIMDIFGLNEISPIPISCDNQGAIKLIETGVIKQKTKHICVKFHHSHDEQEKGIVRFSYISSAENPADILTKALPLPKLQILKGLIGLGNEHVLSCI